VSVDSVARNKRFAEKYDFPYRLLSDTERKASVAWGAADGPEDRSARRVGAIVDPTGRVAAWHARVSAASWPSEALAIVVAARSSPPA
jgi:peroxiredoxin Q/BCP